MSWAVFVFGIFASFRGELSSGQLFAFWTLAAYFSGPITRLLQIWSIGTANVAPHYLRVRHLCDQAVPRRGLENLIVGPLALRIAAGTRKLETGMEFEFPELSIGTGSCVGIVGPNGSGKTTFCKV